MGQILVTTLESVSIADLGDYTLTHPITDYNVLLDGFSYYDIVESEDFQAAIDTSKITAKFYSPRTDRVHSGIEVPLADTSLLASTSTLGQSSHTRVQAQGAQTTVLELGFSASSTSNITCIAGNSSLRTYQILADPVEASSTLYSLASTNGTVWTPHVIVTTQGIGFGTTTPGVGAYFNMDVGIQGALNLVGLLNGRNISSDGAKLDTIEANAKDDQTAAEVPFTPNGDITSTTVQTAIVEVRDDTDAKIASATNNLINITSNYTILTSDKIINCTAGTITVTLPTAVGKTGKEYTIKNSGSTRVTIATTSSQTIDGEITAVIRQRYASITVVSDSTNWIII